MKVVKLINGNPEEKNELIADSLITANNFFTKLSGLVFKKLKEGQCLLIENCRSIHTFGMRYNIDVVFLDEKNRVLAIFQNIKPFKITPFINNAKKVLELKSGEIKKTSLKVGDYLQFK